MEGSLTVGSAENHAPPTVKGALQVTATLRGYFGISRGASTTLSIGRETVEQHKCVWQQTVGNKTERKKKSQQKLQTEPVHIMQKLPWHAGHW